MKQYNKKEYEVIWLEQKEHELMMFSNKKEAIAYIKDLKQNGKIKNIKLLKITREEIKDYIPKQFHKVIDDY